MTRASATPSPSAVPDRESLLASALDAIVSIDAGGLVVEFNPSAERMFGYSRDAALAQPLADLIVPPSQRDAHRAGVARVAAGGTFRLVGRRLEVPAIRADGSEFPAELTITQTSSEPFMVTAFVRDLSDRVASERALRDSEELFASAFMQAPMGIVLFHVEDERGGRILRVNEALLAMTGFAERDLIGEPISELGDPAELESSAALFGKVLAGRRDRVEAERRVRRADGSVLWTLVHVTTVRSDDDRPLYGIAQLIDISERIAAERAVMDSEARLAKTQQMARIGSWEWHVDEDRFLWSNELAYLFGDPGARRVGRADFLAAVHREDRARVEEVIERALAGRTEGSWEYRLHTADGRTAHVYSWGDVVIEDGRPARIQGYAQDVTERRLAESRAADLRRDNELIVNAAADGIYRVDADGRATFVNPAAAEILGYSVDELIGQQIHALAHHTHIDGTPQRWEECPARLASVDGEVRRLPDDVLWRKDGTAITVDLTAAPVRVDGRPAGAVVVFSDVTERRAMERQLRRLAEIDTLTGLPNRHHFEQVLAERLADARGAGALMLIDLDHFKFVNDSLGHAAGDDLIREVAAVLAAQIRGGDVLARLGGDEFALLLPRAESAEADAVARRLLAGLESARPSGLSVSASIGVTTFTAGERSTASDLLVAADIALYEAKDAGRGRAEFFSGRPGASLTWVERIRSALDQDRLTVFSQPIVDLATGATVQEELLVRLVDENGAIVPPSSFLPTAESFGLIGDIDRWVLRRGVRMAATGRRIHVNLSGRSLGSRELLDEFEGWLRETGADPANVVIELTETLAVANMTQAGKFAARVRALGCAMALDDFGTGFGSFTYLKHLPADYLKIDMEFVRNVATDEHDRRVVAAIVDVARRFDLQTIAEGVEDQATLAVLREEGVDCAQGFLLGRPAAVGNPEPV